MDSNHDIAMGEIETPVDLDSKTCLLDTEKICRGCLTDKGDLKSVFSTWYTNIEYLRINEMLLYGSSLEVSADDGLPTQICTECISQASAACSFKRQCEQSASTLRKLIGNSERKVESLKVSSGKCQPRTLLVTSPEVQLVVQEECEEGYFISNDGDDFRDDTENSILTFVQEPPSESNDYELFTCWSCHKSFLSSADLQLHEPDHDNVEIIKCHQCQIEYETPQEFEDHNKTHLEYHNVCGYCEETYKKPSAFHTHMSNHKKKIVQNSQNNIGKPKELEKYENAYIKEEIVEICQNELGATNKCNEFVENITHDKSHMCRICDKNFAHKTSLHAHMKIHNRRGVKKPYICLHCDQGFKLSSSLEVHIRKTHTKERVFKCKKCHKTYTELRDLNRHAKTHSEAYRCHVCEKMFAFRQSLRTHLRAHNRRGTFTCADCGQQFKDDKLRERHMKITHSGESHECIMCNKSFTHVTKLRTHMKSHNTDSEKKLQCEYCPKKFNFVHHLQNHERTHTGARPFLCNKCGRGFTQSHYLTVHLRQHEDVQPYPCNYCSKTFAQHQRLSRHIQTHTGEKPFMCNECGKRFSANATLKRHLETHGDSTIKNVHQKKRVCIKKELRSSGKNPNVTCRVCNETFVDSHSLGVHMRTHTCQYICAMCNRGFSLPSTLESHMKSHAAGERQHVCQICEQRYNRPEHLKSHFRRAHSNDRPHICTICNRGFCQSGELTIHMRRHTGEKPYVCPYCNKGFPASTALTIHIRIHTGEKPYKCAVCSRAFSTSSSLLGHMNTHTAKQTESFITEDVINPIAIVKNVDNIDKSQEMQLRTIILPREKIFTQNMILRGDQETIHIVEISEDLEAPQSEVIEEIVPKIEVANTDYRTELINENVEISTRIIHVTENTTPVSQV